MKKIGFVLLALVSFVGGGAGAAEEALSPAPLILSVWEAVLMSLEHNRALQVQRFEPQIARTGEEQAAAAFDTSLTGEVNGDWSRARLSSDGDFQNSNKQGLTLGASRFFAAGTTLGIDMDSTRSGDPAEISTRLGLSLTQALLQGRGAAANLATLWQARIDTALSVHELRGYAEALVAQVEEACWDYILAARSIEIVERSLRLAEDQLAEVRERIAVGRLAEIEAAAAEAETAVRREALINARSALTKSRLNILRLLNPPGNDPLGRDLRITDLPTLPPADPDPVESHVALARRLRADLSQARLQLERGDLEVVKTRNGLLPKLDLFINLGRTGYASSFGRSFDLGGEGYDVQAGFIFRFPWGNRFARAAEHRAILSREQAAESIANLEQLVEVDVRGAWIEVDRLREQAAATATSLRLQEEKLRAETEKFRVGKSTTYLVAQAQRDLLQVETNAVSAVAGCLKAVAELYRHEGSLLERRGLRIAVQ